MDVLQAPGLTAEWLNAWLAALGVTVVLPQVRLSWSDDVRPVALFHAPSGADIAADLAAAMPDVGQLAIALMLPGRPDFPRNPPMEVYWDRAVLARQLGDFSLGSTITDLQDPLPVGGLSHSPFDPPAPQGRTLHQRLADCRAAIDDDLAGHITASLAGSEPRIAANGLGFDYRRFVAGVQPKAAKSVDPVVECLAFFGLALFPVRGDGARERTRGWQGKPSRAGAFRWPAWSQPLDRWGIDALMDLVTASASTASRGRPRLPGRTGVTALFESIPYRWQSTLDTTRAYASRRVQ